MDGAFRAFDSNVDSNAVEKGLPVVSWEALWLVVLGAGGALQIVGVMLVVQDAGIGPETLARMRDQLMSLLGRSRSRHVVVSGSTAPATGDVYAGVVRTDRSIEVQLKALSALLDKHLADHRSLDRRLSEAERSLSAMPERVREMAAEILKEHEVARYRVRAWSLGMLLLGILLSTVGGIGVSIAA